MNRRILSSLAGMLLALVLGSTAFGQTIIVSDDCTATNNGSGFKLNEGVNSGINPPAITRLTGTVASELRYFQTFTTGRPVDKFLIGGNRIRVNTGAQSGRFSISENGTTPFDFASALGTAGATPTNPALYDVTITMRNDTEGTTRLSFGLSTVEDNVTTWDFGIQIYRATTNDGFYTIQKRIDGGSSGAGDINAVMSTTAPGTYQQNNNNFLLRVADAGAESGTNYHSRVQVSLDDGNSWIYDTATDPVLSNGWRFDGRTRYFSWDQAGGGSAPVFYDNFSVVSTYAPPPPTVQVWTGAGLEDNWSTGANWDGTAPLPGEPLVFGLSSRQANYNDMASLLTPTLTFTNGGFVLAGNPLAVESAVQNLAGNNTINLSLDWPSTTGKNWQIAAGTELTLSGASTVATAGNHTVNGGGTLRLTGSLDINATPAFIINEGKFVLDGGVYSSLGGFRIGSSAAATAPVEVVVSNGASLTLELPAANLRVGDGAVGVPSRLIVNNGTVTMLFGNLGIPFAAGCTGEVLQTGGVVKDCYVVFSDSGAGVGTYLVDGGTLEPFQIRKDSAAGTAAIRFQNAWLRPALGTTNAADFMSGLDLAEIQSGGLTIDATTDITIAQALSGAGGLTKASPSTTTLTGQNSYAGNTEVQAGKLVLPTVQTNGSTVLVANGAELGVARAVPNASLTAGGLSLGTSTLSFDLGPLGNPTAPLVKVTSLTTSGGAGSVTVNVSGGLGLTVGTYTLVDYSGAIGGSGFGAFTLGTLPLDVVATLSNNVANSSIDLKVSATGTVTPPTIGTITLSGGDFVFSGTGGVEGKPYYVVTSPTVETPLPSWLPVQTNVFGPGGTFTFTTNIVSGAPKAFYRLQVPLP